MSDDNDERATGHPYMHADDLPRKAMFGIRPAMLSATQSTVMWPVTLICAIFAHTFTNLLG